MSIEALLLTILLVAAFFAIYDVLKKIADRPSTSPDISGIKDELEEIKEKLEVISVCLGGDEKMKEKTAKERRLLKERIQHLLISLSDGKMTPGKARKQAEQYLEEAEFEDSHKKWGSYKLDSLKDWVNNAEIEERNKKKYTQFLGKARDYIKTKEKIFPHGRDRQDMADSIGTDYAGAGWLIKKLAEEEILEKIEEYSSETGSTELKHYKVKKR